MIASYDFYFSQPWWLIVTLLVVPMAWLGLRNLKSLGKPRLIAAIVLRGLVIALLAAILARPLLGEKSEQITLLAVMDRSQSIPDPLQKAGVDYILKAIPNRQPKDQLAVIDIGETAAIELLPSKPNGALSLEHRSTSLAGDQSYLEGGLKMALAIAPPDTAARILLVSDGNETSGDLREAARIAAANKIPIDVLPLTYRHTNEVVFNRMVAPPRARNGATVPLKFVLNSTTRTTGKLMLSLNGKLVKLNPSSNEMAAAVTLEGPGVTVMTVSMPLATRGIQEFQATFVPDDPAADRLAQNNRASAMTYVAGEGHVLIVDSDGKSSASLMAALKEAKIDVRYKEATNFPTRLSDLLDVDCVILTDTDNSAFTLEQQQMLVRYVSDMGGGLIMTGGPNSFGAGSWIGSPVAEILPVDLDPPQKQQMPKGALVLIMHACEMPDGNMWGKKVALAAIKTLSRLDEVGVMSYQYDPNNKNWVYPLSPVGNKSAVTAAINSMEMGDMPDFTPHLQGAYDKLKAAKAGQKHVIIISDGDPGMPPASLLNKLKAASITVSGVAVYPHTPEQVGSLEQIAKDTGGRFYNVTNANQLPQIFIKEAQVVRRALIIEEPFIPQVAFAFNEVIKGLGAMPRLEGYVLTGRKGGLNVTVLKSAQGDPVLATGQAGLGKVIAFTSTADNRWAAPWISWGGYRRFWEQAVRWSAKTASSSECEIFADVQDRRVEVTVESADAQGNYLQLGQLGAKVIAPDMQEKELTLNQVGPGRYRAQFQAQGPGSYLINMQYAKGAAAPTLIQSVVTVPYAPEFNDLTDNAALLTEIAQMTGGRVLSLANDAARTNLFDRTNVTYPRAAQPLTSPLAIAWLVIFILDVAVRRIALDLKPLTRRLASLFQRGQAKGRQADDTLGRLKSRHQQVKGAIDERSKQTASRHYEAAANASADMPTTNASAPPPERAAAPKGPAPTPPPAVDNSPLGRLLKAKKDANDRMKGKQ